MDKDKQIEEMAKDIEVIGANGYIDFYKTAKILHDKDYRKASEVAEELINTALSKIQIMISGIKAQEENGNITEFNGGAKTALEIVFKDIAELKKKYTEGCDGQTD